MYSLGRQPPYDTPTYEGTCYYIIHVPSSTLFVILFVRLSFYVCMYVCTACPYGLDWDGESCDILVANGDEQYSSHSHWLDSLMGYRTLLLMFLVSLIVSVATLVVKSRSTFNYRKTSQETRTKDNVSTSQNRTKNKSFSRVEDLLHPS